MLINFVAYQFYFPGICAVKENERIKPTNSKGLGQSAIKLAIYNIELDIQILMDSLTEKVQALSELQIDFHLA